MSHPDSFARRPIDPAMRNSFRSYSEPGTRNSYEAETSPVVRDADVDTPELRRRRVKAWGVIMSRGDAAQNRADAEIITIADAEAVETTEVVVATFSSSGKFR